MFAGFTRIHAAIDTQALCESLQVRQAHITEFDARRSSLQISERRSI